MAKKSKQKATASRPWEQNEVDQLLAWIDYCRQYGIDFWSTVINHLKTSTGYEPSERRVRDKLHRVLGRSKSQDCETVDQLIERGTEAGLGRLNAEERERIRKAAIQLKPPRPRRRLRSRNASTLSPARSFSTSRTVSLALNFPSRRLRLDPYSVPATPEPEEDEGEDEEGKDIERVGRVLRSGRKLGNVPSTKVSTAVPIPPCLVQRHERSAARVRAASETPLQRAEEIATTELPAAQDPDQRLPDRQQSAQDHKIEELRARLQERDTKILRQKREIFHLQNRLHAARAEYDALGRCRRATEADPVSFEDELTLRRDCDNMRADLAVIREQEMVLMSIDSNSIGPPPAEVKEYLWALQGAILDACSSPAFEAFPSRRFDERLPNEGIAQSWARKALSTNGSAELASTLTEGDVPVRDLLRALVAVALCNLIFEADFFEDLGADSPLLSSYRHHVAARYGHQTLHQLDILAIDSAATKPYFTESIIPTRAKEIAEYICTCLGGLEWAGMAQRREESGSMLASTTDISPTEALRRAVLNALELQRSLLMSQSRYKFVFFSPSELYDARTMRQDGVVDDIDSRRGGNEMRPLPTHGDTGGAQHDGKTIKLCLFPAVYVREQATEFESRTSQFSKSSFERETCIKTEDEFGLLARGLVLL